MNQSRQSASQTPAVAQGNASSMETQAATSMGGNSAMVDSLMGQEGGGGSMLQSREWFEEQQAQGNFGEISSQQFFQEFLAKNLAYKDPSITPDDPRYDPANGMGYSEYDREMLEGWGYAVPSADDRVVNESTGLRATRFDPLDPDSGLSSEVSFRGTDDYGGIRSDTSLQIGGDEYYQNADEIDALIAGGAGDVGLSGHSLGGAVASIAASHNTDEIGSLTTFQGAGVDSTTAMRFAAGAEGQDIDVNHFVAASDTVHRAGEAQLDGTVHETTVDGMDSNLEMFADGDIAEDGMNAHTSYFNYDPSQDPTSSKQRLVDQYGEENTEVTLHDGDSVGMASRHLHEGGRQLLGSVVNPLMDVGETGMDWWEGMSGAYEDYQSGESGLMGTAGQMALETGEGLLGLGGDLAEAAITAPLQVAKGVANLGVGAGALAADGAGMVWDAASGAASDAYDWTSGAASDAWDATSGAASGAWDATSGAVGDVWDATSGVVSDTWDATSGIANDAWAKTSGAASNVWDATSGAAGDVADWTADTASSAWDALTDW